MGVYGRSISIEAVGGKWNFFCRMCGKIHNTKEVPSQCGWCGNPQSNMNGFGVSGDAIDGTTHGDSVDRGEHGRFITKLDEKVIG